MGQDTFQEGKIPFKIAERDQPCETYYKIYGDLHSGPPLVVLHGGPGAGHEYVEPYSKISIKYGIPVVFYDQIGCGASTHLPEKKGDKSFWRPSLFIAELQNVLNFLDIGRSNGPGFYLFGHSWGAMFATDFVANCQPLSLRKLILGGGSVDSRTFKNDLWELKSGFPAKYSVAIDKAIQQNNFKSAEYLEAEKYFYQSYFCRANPWPPEMLQIMKHQAEDSTVNQALLGLSPWLYNGSLEHYSSIQLLPQIKVPTLVFNGEFDTARDNMMQLYVDHIPNVRWVKFSNASHIIHLDSPELLEKALQLVGEFLQ